MLVAILAATLAAVSSSSTLVAAQRGNAAQNRRPNILLIIMDDVGMDVTTDMYPGLIDDLTKQYGPSGLNHPGYRAINGSPASTPNLDRLAGLSHFVRRHVRRSSRVCSQSKRMC
jgi:hypothetical protein